MNRKPMAIAGLICAILILSSIFPLQVSAAPSIISITPNLINNDAVNEITINGNGFETGTYVIIGSINVTTTVISNDTLEAVIGAGFPTGTYPVTVVNPDHSEVTVPAGLTIQAAAPTPAPFSRPQIVIDAYSISVPAVKYNQEFTLDMSLDNAGSSTAYNIQVTFTSSDLIMLRNGGVVGGGSLGVVGKVNFSQAMTAASVFDGVTRASVEMNVSYSDEKGTLYTDKFILYFPATPTYYYSGSGTIATATPTGIHRSQLIITSTTTDIEPLQPGLQFSLDLVVQNSGNLAAKGVTMIVGGGNTSGSGTPQAGISGGGGEFTNFAPVGASNIQSLGDIQPGTSISASQKLVVNVSTNPGAYPMRVTFSYIDGKANPVNDEQVITLMVYDLPKIEVNFYQPVEPLVAGQTALLPLQVVSLGKRTAVLGKMTVASGSGTIDNGESLIGSLDPGGYFTLDAMLTPSMPGPLDVTVTIAYKDDFNQSQTITQILALNVMELPLEPSPDPEFPVAGGEEIGSPESFWKKIWRFILGVLGLDSGKPSSIPAYDIPTSIPIQPAVPGGKG